MFVLFQLVLVLEQRDFIARCEGDDGPFGVWALTTAIGAASRNFI